VVGAEIEQGRGKKKKKKNNNNNNSKKEEGTIDLPLVVGAMKKKKLSHC